MRSDDKSDDELNREEFFLSGNVRCFENNLFFSHAVFCQALIR